MVIREADGETGADVGPFVLVTPGRGFLVYSTDFDLSSHLKPFTLSGGVEPGLGLHVTLGYVAAALVVDHRAGTLFFPDGGNLTRHGVFVFDAVEHAVPGDAHRSRRVPDETEPAVSDRPPPRSASSAGVAVRGPAAPAIQPEVGTDEGYGGICYAMPPEDSYARSRRFAAAVLLLCALAAGCGSDDDRQAVPTPTANIPYADYDFATDVIGPPFDCSAVVPALLAYDYLTVTHLALGNAINSERNPSIPGLPLTGRTAIAGVVYRPAAAVPFALPPPFRDTLLMTDWTRDVLAAVEFAPDDTLQRVVRFLPEQRFLRPIDLEAGPDGALYVLEYGSGYTGDNLDAALSRVEYSADGGLTPAAVLTAEPAAGQAPLTVRFSAAGSRAVGREPGIASYEWDVDGDGDVDASGPELTHTYTANGVYPASLTVTGRSGRRSFPAVTEVVVGNTPPTVTILEPAAGATVVEDSMVRLRGAISDLQNPAIDCDEAIWEVRLGHNAHAHPLNLVRGCEAMFPATLLGHDRGDLFLVVELRYTDQGGANAEPPLTGRASVRLTVAPASE